MTDIIKLVKKYGALELRIGWVLTKEQLEMVETAIRQDQIEKDGKIANQMIMTSWNAETDAHNKCALEIRNGIRKQLTKQVHGDV